MPFIEKYEKGQKLSKEEHWKIFSRLDEIGRVALYNGMIYYSPVIKEEIIAKIMACAKKNKKTSELAARYLLHFSKEDLRKYSAEITDSIDLLRSNIKLSLLYFNSAARKKYADILRKEIIDNDRVNLAERLLLDVKLGNDAALDTMIYLLQTSDDIKLKESLVHYLGILGTDRCIIALLNAMNDNQEVEKGASLREDIIRAIRRNYPDDELFLKYFRLGFDDDWLGGKDGITLIYKELEQWAKNKFNYDLDLSKAHPTFLDREKNIRKFYYPCI